jgi:hypothetical protein
MGWIMAAIGVFSISGGVFNWDWFMNHRKAWLFVKIFGRTGARIFYGLLGTFLVVVGVVMGLGSIQQSD